MDENITELEINQSEAEEETVTFVEEETDLWQQNKLIEQVGTVLEWSVFLVIAFITFPSMVVFTTTHMPDYLLGITPVVVALFAEGGAALWGFLLSYKANTSQKIILCAPLAVYDAGVVMVVSICQLIKGFMSPGLVTALSMLVLVNIFGTLIGGYIYHALDRKKIARWRFIAITGHDPYISTEEYRRITEAPQRQLEMHVNSQRQRVSTYTLKQVATWRQHVNALIAEHPGIGERKLLKLTQGKIPTRVIRDELVKSKTGN